ncbi:MAG TPA: hypothetical protein VGK76_06785 [Candidatus Eisenbacteria bacterium]|jgi:hypothetical protein
MGEIHVRLRSELQPARGTLGDRVSWRLTASLGAGAQAGSVIVGDAPRSLEIDTTRATAERAARGGSVWSREFVVRGFDLGPIELPRAALPIRAGARADTVEFPRDTLFVDSLTPAASGAIRPDRGPIEPPLRLVDYIVAAFLATLVVAALVLLVGHWIRGRRRRPLPAIEKLPEPPEAVLRRTVDALQAEFAAIPRDVFYERLSLALRAYAAAVTGVPAPDLTTSELARELARDRRVRSKARDNLIAALLRADLAKFARLEDEESEAKAILRLAESIAGRLVGAA